MRRKHFWLRADVELLKQLVNEKSNPELLEHFKITLSELTSALSRYHIKRDPEFIKQLLSKSGEANSNWRGGKPKDVKKHRQTQLERFPERDKARKAVDYAIRSGKIIKPTICPECGAEPTSRNMHFHHTEDYSLEENWLIGVWVCRKCHRALHNFTH